MNSSSDEDPKPEIISPVGRRTINRRSLEVGFKGLGLLEDNETGHVNGAPHARPGSLQSSYSTSDLPTIKNPNGVNSNLSPPKTHAEKHLHNHNASLGRIPIGAVSNRHSRDLSSASDQSNREESQPMQSLQSVLQASAAPFGPSLTSSASTASSSMTSPAMPGFANQGLYNNYQLQMMNMGMGAGMGMNGMNGMNGVNGVNGMNGMNGGNINGMNGANGLNGLSGMSTVNGINGMNSGPMANQMQMYNQMQAFQQNGFAATQIYGNGNMHRLPDSQARVMHQRRMENSAGMLQSSDVSEFLLTLI